MLPKWKKMEFAFSERNLQKFEVEKGFYSKKTEL